jgi:hypothetical protein
VAEGLSLGVPGSPRPPPWPSMGPGGRLGGWGLINTPEEEGGPRRSPEQLQGGRMN